MNLTLITSVINTPELPLSYIKTRSIYSREERFEQTKQTIKTIREKIPDNKILLVECSQLTPEETDYFTKHTDIFLNIFNTGDRPLINRMFTPSKAMGEGTMTIYALHYLFSNNVSYCNFFKISGRYWLTDNFNYKTFNNKKIVAKFIDNDTTNALTSLYKLPFTDSYHWYNYLLGSENKFRECAGYENIFAQFLETIDNNKIIITDKIGVAGHIAVSGDKSDT
jgi:hypothetical protein